MFKKICNITIGGIVGGMIGSVIVAGIVFFLIFENRAVIFNYFAHEYMAQVLSDRKLPASEEKSTERPILSQESLIVNIVKKANPAVVSIVVTKDVPIIEEYFDNFIPFNDPFFGPFEFRVPRYRQKGTEKREIGGGTGFFVSSDGMILTNRHVVDDSEAEYTVFTNDGKKYAAKIVAKDPFFDLAVLRVKGDNFPYLEFETGGNLELGQTVIAIGNALGEFRNSVSVGVVSGLARSIVAGDGRGQSELLEEVIQTDAAINPGNSGGPLLSLSGRVVGVNVAVALGSENIGFALPASVAADVVESVKRYGEIIRPYLGVRYMLVTPAVQEKNNLPFDYGAVVVRGEDPQQLAVIPGSPADKAGILENDIILEVDGVKISPEHSLAQVIRRKKVGDKVKITVWREGATLTLEATLEKAP